MPTPILKIPIDDEAVRRYFAAFEKYQNQLKLQPEMWKDTNATLNLMAGAMAGVAAEIAHQTEVSRKLSEEEKKREEAVKKAAKERADADKAEAEREKAAAARRRHAIDQVKEYSRTLADAAVNLGKWALIGGGASFAGGALGLWGLDRFVAGVGEERRLSQGFGVSMGQRQGAGINMQRYFDVNSVLETVANAQATPGDWSIFRMMGVDPRGKNPADLTNEMALAARRMFLADNGNLALAQAQGLTRIFSPDDLRRLAATPESDLRRSIADSQRLAAGAGLRDEVGRKWQNFLINVDTAGLKIKNVLIDRLTTLEPSLEKFVSTVGGAVADFLGRPEFKQGLETFAKYISDGNLQRDFKIFADDVGIVAKKLAEALVFLGILPSAPSNPGGPAPAGVPNAGTYGLPSGKSVWYGLPRQPGSFAFSMQAENYAGQQFLKWGWSKDQVKGLLANALEESNFNPFAKGDHGAAYGISQWHKDRQNNYAALFGHTMQSVKDPEQALREQIEFMQWELTSSDRRNSFKKAGDALKRAHSAYEAGVLVSREYERPAGGAATAALRGVRATVGVTIHNQTGASVATTVNSAAGG